MTRKEEITAAEKLATDMFNALPLEQRKKLANPLDRLLEINLILSKGDSLNIAYLKQREKNLEDWLLEWKREIDK